MDPDMNKYDLEHACTGHPKMSKEVWEKVYADAWDSYYSDEHVETIMRRAIASGIRRTKIIDSVIVFSGAARIESVHPLQFGYVRRKVRTHRRARVLNPLLFYPWRAFDFLRCGVRWYRLIRRYRKIMARIEADPEKLNYMDEALQPITSESGEDHLAQIFADKIPKTHGAPKQHAVAAE
jgi:hypothetical protein